MRLRAALAFVVLLLGTPFAARAENFLHSAGLLGVWAHDCDHPASPTNFWAIFARSIDGRETLTYSLGPQYQENVYIIHGGTRPAPERLVLQEEGTSNHSALEVTILAKKTRWRVIDSQDRDTGRMLVRDGTIALNGRETPWFKLCHR